MMDRAEIFDGNGGGGIWDSLNDQFGMKTLPVRNTLPWAMITNSNTSLSVWADGRFLIKPTGQGVEDAKDVENYMEDNFGKHVMSEREYAVAATTLEIKVRFGVMGPAAMQKSKEVGFRSGVRR